MFVEGKGADGTGETKVDQRRAHEPGGSGTVPLSRWARIAAVGILLAAGLATRIYQIDSETMWHDEHFNYQSLCQAKHLTDFFNDEWNISGMPIINPYFIMQFYWAHWVGKDVLSLRFLSVLFGMAALFSLYVLTKRMFGFTAGLCALLFGCLSNIHIYYGQELREYALVVLLSVWSMDSFHRACHGNGRLALICHYIVSFFLLFTHIFTSFLLVAQGVYLLIIHRRRPWRVIPWAAGHLPAVLAVAWWLSTINFSRLRMLDSWIPLPGLRELARGMTWDGCYLPQALFHGELGLAALSLALWMLWRAARSPERATDAKISGTKRENLLLLCCWLIVPPVCLFLLSYLNSPYFLLRYVLYSSCALFLLFSAALSSIRPAWLRNTAITGFAALMVWHCCGEYRPFRPNNEACAKLIARNMQPGDKVLIYRSLHALKFFTEFHPDLKAENGMLAPWQAIPKGKNLWAVYNRVSKDTEFAEFERGMQEHDCRFERFKISAGSYTFMYISADNFTLDFLFPTTLYRIWAPDEPMP